MQGKPSITELHHSGKYALVESFSVHDKASFWAKEVGLPIVNNSTSLKKELKSPSFWVIIIGSILAGSILGYYINDSVEQLKVIDYTGYFQQIGFSIFFFLLIILPIHEAIHLLTYRWLGASQVGFYGNLRKAAFFAYAHRFVMSLQEHAVVAIMPFFIITAILLALLISLPQIQVFCLFTLVFHTLNCIKDFIVVRHYIRRRHQTFFLYDDYIQNRSYLFSTIYIR